MMRLWAFLANKLPNAIAFNLPVRKDMIWMPRTDMSAGHANWIGEAHTEKDKATCEQSSFLAPVDDAGRYADFHAFRHTFISNLAAAGVHPKTAQALARHSTFALTMDRYTHTYRPALSDAVAGLPDLSQPILQPMIATGTNGAETPGENLAHFNVSEDDKPQHCRKSNTANQGKASDDKIAKLPEKSGV